MSFFERQASARRSSRQLILLFALAVLAIVLAVSLVVVSSVLLLDDEARLAASSLPDLLRAQLPLLWMVSVLTLGLILIASWKRGYELSQGGSLIARQLGGREIGSGCNDPNDRRLRNIVEELAIAACLPVPAVYVLDKEPGINAFAAGHTPSDAAIAVTRGALERLNRDELQGVIAHEFSHVLNGDMRLNIRLVGVLYGIVVLGVIGRYLLRYGRGSRDSRGTAVVLLAAALVVAIGAIGVFFGRLIKASVSRSREALADASALQFTRQSAGLAGALKKIAALSEGAALQHPKAEEVSHMLFGEWRSYSRWFATHPPLLERIQALDPSFSAAQLEALRRDWKQAPPSGMAEDTTLGLVGSSLMQGALRLPDPSAELRPQPGATSARIAQPQSDDARRASSLHQLVPERLGAAARSPESASALVLAMLVDRDRAVQARQLAEVAVELNEDIADVVAELVVECQALHAALRLPTVALAFPALRRKPRGELQRLVKCCDRLVHLDGRVSLFDYCLSRMLQSQVIETWEPQHYRAAGTRKLFECTDALADLFSTLVSYGHDDPDAMRRAFVAGLVIVLPQHRFHFAPPPNWVAALDRALAQLDGLDAAGKQLLVEGLVNAVAHDGRITVHEAELIRTICSCLHCPLPPIVEQRARSRS